MEELFKTVFTALKTLSWLKQITSDEGQLEAIDETGNLKPVTLLPAVLIDVQAVQWEAGDLLTQDGTVTLITRFAFRKTSDQSNLTGTALFNASIAALKKRSDVEKVIANAAALAGVHGRVNRITTTREHRNDGIIVYRTTWVSSISESLV